MAVGVPVRATRYLGAIHDLALLNQIAETLLREQPSPRSSIPCARSLRSTLSEKDIHETVIQAKRSAVSQSSTALLT